MKIVRLRGDEWAPGNCRRYFVMFLDYRAGRREDAARRGHGSAAYQEAYAAPRASEASAAPPRPCPPPTMSSRELFSRPAVRARKGGHEGTRARGRTRARQKKRSPAARGGGRETRHLFTVSGAMVRSMEGGGALLRHPPCRGPPRLRCCCRAARPGILIRSTL